MIEQLIGSGIGFGLGLFASAWLLRRHIANALMLINEQEDAHSRLSDAHNSTKERIERALEYCRSGKMLRSDKVSALLKGDA